jgi:hypothetical protein
MGLKKRSLSLVGRGKPSHHRYKRWQLGACGTERYTKKGLGFFGHVTEQVSGSRESEAVEEHKNLSAATQDSTQHTTNHLPPHFSPYRARSRFKDLFADAGSGVFAAT